MTIRRLRLTPGAPQYEFPNRVRISAPGRKSQDVVVAPDGSVTLFHSIRSRTVRLTVLRVRAPIGKADFVRYLDAVAVAEIRVPGLAPPPPSRRGSFQTACGALSVIANGTTEPGQVYGSLAALDRGDPLRLRSCGGGRGLELHRGANLVYAPVGLLMQPDHIVLDSPAPDPLPVPVLPRLTSPGSASRREARAVCG